ncbi:MAG: AMP-binding protein, partial [Myxococcales bacterium]|nr:AMP-binding protein [Myxococcales bacterium]
MSGGLEPLFRSDDGPDSALDVDGVAFSRAELFSLARGHARQLESLGVRPGDRVGLWAARHPLVPIALLGNAIAGAVSVPLNASLGADELAHVEADAAPKLIFHAPGHPPRVGTVPLHTLERKADGAGHRPAAMRMVDDAPLLVLYTSGTTGKPKGAVLTATNVARNLDGLAEAWALDPRDTIVHALPLFHVHGLVLGLFGA